MIPTVRPSVRLQLIIRFRVEAAYRKADGLIFPETLKSDVVFESGVALGIRAQNEQKDIFVCQVKAAHVAEVTFFVLASNENEACEIAEKWELD